MTSTRAIIVDPDAPGHLALGEVERQPPQPNEAVVQVQAISLNRGEVRQAQGSVRGARPGWDIAGAVTSAAADGSGPAAGQRVVGLLRTGAWAETLNVPTSNLAVLPDSVSVAAAAALPVAGLTALYALDRAKGLAGRSVLVTGASGGVGNYGVQIAAASGATVTALVRQERYADLVRSAGAVNVVVDETGAAAKEHGPFDLVLEAVGGATFASAITMLSNRGLLVSYGMSDMTDVVLSVPYMIGHQGTATAFLVFEDMLHEGAAAGLRRLLRLVETRRLTPLVSLQEDWSQIGAVAQQLLDRAFPGKAVLTIS